MAAIDFFDWFVSTLSKSVDTEMRKFLQEQRAYLLTLRSEDERQRFVDDVVREINASQTAHNRQG